MYMKVDMHDVALLLSCLACGCHAKPVPISFKRLQNSASAADQKPSFAEVNVLDRQRCDNVAPNPMKVLASFLLVLSPMSGFKLSNPGLFISVGNPGGAGSRWEVVHPRQQPWLGARSFPRSPRSVQMCKQPANQSAENPALAFLSKGLTHKWIMSGQNMIKSHGVTVAHGYFLMRYFNLGITLSIAWASFSKASGLSPLAPGQWKGFMGVFLAIHIALGVFTRPMCIALAVALKPLLEGILTKIEDRLLTFSERLFTLYTEQDLPLIPKDPKKFSQALSHLALDMFATIPTCAVMGLGIYIASLVTGVPAFPLGWRSLWNWKAFLFLR